eukprot:g18946.t1
MNPRDRIGPGASNKPSVVEGERPSQIERRAVELCLEAVRGQMKRREEEGLSATAFFVGVSNVIFITYVFGAFPEHFWLLYALESLYLFPKRWARARRTGRQLYWLDYCWCVNFIGQTVLTLFFTDAMFRAIHQNRQAFWQNALALAGGRDTNANTVSPLTFLLPEPIASTTEEWIATYLAGYRDSYLTLGVRRLVFGTLFGSACGPLVGAVITLQNALVFHSVDQLIGIFIHLFPALLFYTLRFKTARIQLQYPGVFDLSYIPDMDPVYEILLPSIGLYWAWWLLYTPWLLLVGRTLPARSRNEKTGKFLDTVMHSILRTGTGPVCAAVDKLVPMSPDERAQRRKADDFTVGQTVAYMLTHALTTHVGFCLSLPMFHFRNFFRGFLVCSVLSSIWQASTRYAHQLGKAYEKALVTQLGDTGILLEGNGESRDSTASRTTVKAGEIAGGNKKK